MGRSWVLFVRMHWTGIGGEKAILGKMPDSDLSGK